MPLPKEEEVVACPNEGFVPYWNHAVVERPFGLTLPFNVALFAVMEDVNEAKMIGSPGVLKLSIEPLLIPAELEAATRK